MENPDPNLPRPERKIVERRRRNQMRLPRPQRNMVERLRRDQMRFLYSQLSSLLPRTSSWESVPVPELLGRATAYVEQLKWRVEELKTRKKQLQLETDQSTVPSTTVLSVEDMGSSLNVNLAIARQDQQGQSKIIFFLSDVIRVLQEEGASVLGVSYSTAGDKMLCTIFSQAFSSRIGIEITRVQERLQQLSL